MLANWALANLLSDNMAPDDRYQYNSGTWFPSTAGSVTFLLGSINLYHYRYAAGRVVQEGPFLYSLEGFNQRTQPPHSNMYATLGSQHRHRAPARRRRQRQPHRDSGQGIGSRTPPPSPRHSGARAAPGGGPVAAPRGARDH